MSEIDPIITDPPSRRRAQSNETSQQLQGELDVGP